jgi:hypothetical protein
MQVLPSRLVSVGFRPSPPAAPPPFDALLWRVTNDVREARAIVRAMAHGRELRVYVGQELAWSRLYQPHEGSHALLELSKSTRGRFEAYGWTRDITV